MKKAIVIIASIFAIASSVNSQEKNKTLEPKGSYFSKLDTLKIPTLVKVVTIDSVNISIEVLKEFASQIKANKLPLYVSLDWVALNYQFIKKATNPGLNDDQMDLLKQPLIPWIQYLQKLQQEQQTKQKNNN